MSAMEQKRRHSPDSTRREQAPRDTTQSWTRDRPLPENEDDAICIAPLAWLT